MEFDRDKSFGYPVLRPVFADEAIQEMDFQRAQFEPVFSLEVSIENPTIAILEYQFSVSVPEIMQHISLGNLVLAVDVRCKRTFFSKRYLVDLEGELELELSNLRHEIEVHPYIIADKDFEFSSTHIHPDFGYDTFSLKRGNIIAWHPAMPFSVEKDQYKSVRSIIDFQPTPKMAVGKYTLGTENDYVIVFAHPDFINSCRLAEQIASARYGLLSSFYIPLIAELYLHLSKDPDKAEELRWASIIRSKSEELNLDWSDEFRILENAQALLRNPLKDFAENGFLNS